MSNALRAAATGQAAKALTIFDFLENPKVKTGIAAVAGKFLTADRMLRLCVNAVKKTPDLQKCDPATVLGAMMASAALGLEPNTVQQQAFLIPYKRRAKVGGEWVDVFDCQFQIGARGFVTLAYRSPLISSFHSEAIHQGDHFKQMQGSKAFLEFSKSLGDRGPLIGAYSFASLHSGREEALVLPLDEILKIRERSETFRALRARVENAADDAERAKAEAKLRETPWIMFEDDMASKTATKKHAKKLPIAASDALAVAAELDDKLDAGAVDLKAFSDVEMVREVVAGDGEVPLIDDTSGGTDVSGERFGTSTKPAKEPAGAGGGDAHTSTNPAAKKTAAAKTSKGGDKKTPTYAELADQIAKAKDRDQAAEILDGVRGELAADLFADLGEHFARTWAA